MSNSILLYALKVARGINEKSAVDEFTAFSKEGYVFCSASQCFYKKENDTTLIIMMPLHGKDFYYPVLFRADGMMVYMSFVGEKTHRFIPIQDHETLEGILGDYKISLNIYNAKIKSFEFEF